ncbi:MAG: DNA-binding response OmpR family regulator [Cellvibrionaceae bacterium]|jgi:DNA-binding response OmpR family regulator
MMTILVVEDDDTLRETIEYNLINQGYKVISVADGGRALEAARTEKPDLILLDVMLPVLDGFEVCRILSQEMSVPILMLTARTEEIDRVVGLEMGADDYISKPFSMRELMARVRATLRRVRLIREEIAAEQPIEDENRNLTPSGSTSAGIQFDDLVIDTERHEVRKEGIALRLKPKEFELLEFLVRHKGIALSRELILERVWGWSYSGNSRTVDVHIRWLREKIEADPTNPGRIITVRGIGYRFEG